MAKSQKSASSPNGTADEVVAFHLEHPSRWAIQQLLEMGERVAFTVDAAYPEGRIRGPAFENGRSCSLRWLGPRFSPGRKRLVIFS